MNKKDNTIIINQKSENNTYKCDVSKPFVIFKDTTIRAALSEFYLDLLSAISGVFGIVGIIALIWSAIINDVTRIIISAIFLLVFVVVGLLFILLARRKRKKYRRVFAGVEFRVFTTISQRIVKEEKYKHYWTVSSEGSDEIIEIWINNYNIEPNQKIAIATIGDKEFILTRCTLIAC